MEETMTQRQPNPESILFHPRTWKGGEWPSDYYAVGVIPAVDLQEVYELANHGDHLSEDVAGSVRWFQPARSMMVGDVVFNCSGTFLCEPSGWRRI